MKYKGGMTKIRLLNKAGPSESFGIAIPKKIVGEVGSETFYKPEMRGCDIVLLSGALPQ